MGKNGSMKGAEFMMIGSAGHVEAASFLRDFQDSRILACSSIGCVDIADTYRSICEVRPCVARLGSPRLFPCISLSGSALQLPGSHHRSNLVAALEYYASVLSPADSVRLSIRFSPTNPENLAAS